MAIGIKVLAFDFDGVIVLESEQVIKEQAWENVAENFNFGEIGRNERLAAQERYSKGRGTRVDILRDTFVALGRAKTEGELSRLVSTGAACFNEAVQDGIVAAGVDPRDRLALQTLARRMPLYINTGTPKNAIRETVRKLGLKDVFKGVYGMPGSKLANLKRVLRHAKCNPTALLFVGDGLHDAKAAEECGCHFVGRANAHNKWQDPMPFHLINSLEELLTLVP